MPGSNRHFVTTGGGGTKEHTSVEERKNNRKTAEELRSVKTRVQRLEEARAAAPPLGEFSDKDVLSPIERVAERVAVSDNVSKTVQEGSTSSFIDDFEDGNMNEYVDSGDVATILNYPVSQGSWAVRIDTDSQGFESDVVSTSGLPYYPRSGDTFRYRLYLPHSDRSLGTFYFGVDLSADNGYQVNVSAVSDTVTLYRIDSGSLTELDSTDLGSVPVGSWFDVEISWDSNGGFDVEVFSESDASLGTASTSDGNYTSGGIGYAALNDPGTVGETTSAYFDYVRTTDAGGLIDDFEDSDISEYSGDVGTAFVGNEVNVPVEHGTYSLELFGDNTTIYTAQGNLDNDAVAGNTFDAHHYLPAGSRARFLWAVQDGSNYFYAEIDERNDNLVFGKVDGGTDTSISTVTSGFTVPTDEWVRLKIEWGGSGGHTIRFYDSVGSQLTNVSGSDSTWTSGGHGWAELADVTSYHDYALFTSDGTDIADQVGVSTSPVSNVGGTRARFNGTLDVLGTASQAYCYFQWRESGVSGWYTTGTQTVSSTGDFSEGIEDLTTDTDYEFRAVAEGDNGTTDTGSIETFTTLQDVQVLAVSTGTSSNIGESEADLTGTLDNLGQNSAVNVGFEFREQGTTAWQQNSFEIALDTGSYTQTVPGLTAGTTYEYRAVAEGDEGTAEGSIQTFSTNDPTEPGIIDDFEDGDLSEYTKATQSGASASITSTNVHDGSHALQLSTGSGNTAVSVISLEGDGLNHYPEAGDSFEYWFKHAQNDSYANCWFGCQGLPETDATRPEGYNLDHREYTDDLILRKFTPSGASTLASTSLSLSPGNWYRGVVEWGAGGNITCRIFDSGGTELASINGSDSAYTSGGFGFRYYVATDPGNLYFDSAKII